MLSCLLKPSGGRARVAGYDLRTEAKQIKRRIGVSPQETAIAGRLTTRENLLLIGAAYGLDPKLSKRRAEELLAAMGLEKRARDRAAGLSGGLARRLSIAMALVADPPVLFLDEPSLGLDPEARSELWTYLGTYKGQKTILLTTHYLEEADNLADSIAVLVDGSILASGSPEEIKNGTRRARRIHVKVLDLAEEAFQSLLAISPSLRRTDFGVEAEGGEADALSLLDGLRAAEARVTGFSVDETSLDEAYLALIGKESKL
jgi:ABC-2 type transport system ATP-binding protein